VGFPTIETNGNTALAVSANHFYLLQNGSGPSLKFSGQDVVAGQFGDWTPLAAEHTASGYEIAWKSLNSNMYSLWNTDANGNYVANIGAPFQAPIPHSCRRENLLPPGPQRRRFDLIERNMRKDGELGRMRPIDIQHSVPGVSCGVADGAS
jgi:hypothetical protein